MSVAGTAQLDYAELMSAAPDKRNRRVDFLLKKDTDWSSEKTALRDILLDLPLTEDVKWKQPCYTSNGKNIVILGATKRCVVLGFFKGALLTDPDQVLVAAGPNSQSAMNFEFQRVDEIAAKKDQIRRLILEAIANEAAGKSVPMPDKDHLTFNSELTAAFANDPKFEQAFKSLTPGRQRGYILLFDEPKKAETRMSRIEKAKPKIFEGKGCHDN